MGAVTVAVVGGRDVAREFGKKGTASDVTLFNHVRDGHALTVVEPTQYPEKLGALVTAVQMADRILFAIPALSREVAETATLLDLVPTPVLVARGPGVGEEEVRRAFRGLRIAEAPSVPLDPVALRAELASWTTAPAQGPTRVPLDHAFPVRGVGAVALGVVRGGPLVAHARLQLCPTPREVEVRSIQVHDVDVPAAEFGERVGVALKGVEADELERGQVLAPVGSLPSASEWSGTDLHPSPYFRGRLEEGSHLQLTVGLQQVPVHLAARAGTSVRLASDRPVAFSPGDRAILCDLSPAVGPRPAASVRLAPA